MTRKLTIFAIALIGLIIYLPAKADTFNIATGFKTSDKPDSSRFVLNTTQKPEYKIFILENPDRIVIDIKNAKWTNVEDSLKNTKRIIGVRHSQKSKDLRIVLDLKMPFALKKHTISSSKNNTYRLVVDIEPKGNSNEAELTSKQYKEIAIPIPKLKEVKKPIIAIDAGHGGHDPGTTGYDGTKEKKITLAYAFALKKALEDTGKYNVILTRKNDQYIDLKKRVEISRNAKANMFISLHADSHKDPLMSGFSIYTLSEKASDKEAEALAQKENTAGLLEKVDIKGDAQDVTELLIDLVQRETKNLSADLAENIITEISPATEVLYINPHRFAGFRVLTAPDIPSALIELGYLSNPKEEEKLLSTMHKNKLAEAIVKAIDKHFDKYPLE